MTGNLWLWLRGRGRNEPLIIMFNTTVWSRIWSTFVGIAWHILTSWNCLKYNFTLLDLWIWNCWHTRSRICGSRILDCWSKEVLLIEDWWTQEVQLLVWWSEIVGLKISPFLSRNRSRSLKGGSGKKWIIPAKSVNMSLNSLKFKFLSEPSL